MEAFDCEVWLLAIESREAVLDRDPVGEFRLAVNARWLIRAN